MSHAVVITGPTASGKSELAMHVAHRFGGVIINADSMQIYRELRIVTARPSPEEEGLAPHMLYGAVSGKEICSAGKWLALAQLALKEVLASNRLPIFTGGTGMYLKALMEGIAQIPDVRDETKAKVRGAFETMGLEAFREEYRTRDSEFRFTDPQRLIRAAEVLEETGKLLSHWQNQPHTPVIDTTKTLILKCQLDREELYARCNARFETMLEKGAIEEVKALLEINLPTNLPIMRAVGVPELAAYIRKETPLELAVKKAQQATRNYAKRQLTWLRNQLEDSVPVQNATFTMETERQIGQFLLT